MLCLTLEPCSFNLFRELLTSMQHNSLFQYNQNSEIKEYIEKMLDELREKHVVFDLETLLIKLLTSVQHNSLFQNNQNSEIKEYIEKLLDELREKHVVFDLEALLI